MYNVCKTTVTASERTFTALVVPKKIDAPGCARSDTRRRSLGAGMLGLGWGRNLIFSSEAIGSESKGIGDGVGLEADVAVRSGIVDGADSEGAVDIARGAGRGFRDCCGLLFRVIVGRTCKLLWVHARHCDQCSAPGVRKRGLLPMTSLPAKLDFQLDADHNSRQASYKQQLFHASNWITATLLYSTYYVQAAVGYL